ncbi:hypothetical protein NDU88_006850 [Pleurodeles waltl]|uniref:Uncharacterized protein n=1 Tax=Pleurodeles waltl TaxID=8319 RepID=A0AAV7UN80_PLEWA|nr:hypothetical protein NDU88_006850 [Pleurodeles waltl]
MLLDGETRCGSQAEATNLGSAGRDVRPLSPSEESRGSASASASNQEVHQSRARGVARERSAQCEVPQKTSVCSPAMQAATCCMRWHEEAVLHQTAQEQSFTRQRGGSPDWGKPSGPKTEVVQEQSSTKSTTEQGPELSQA